MTAPLAPPEYRLPKSSNVLHPPPSSPHQVGFKHHQWRSCGSMQDVCTGCIRIYTLYIRITLCCTKHAAISLDYMDERSHRVARQLKCCCVKSLNCHVGRWVKLKSELPDRSPKQPPPIKEAAPKGWYVPLSSVFGIVAETWTTCKWDMLGTHPTVHVLVQIEY